MPLRGLRNEFLRFLYFCLKYCKYFSWYVRLFSALLMALKRKAHSVGHGVGSLFWWKLSRPFLPFHLFLDYTNEYVTYLHLIHVSYIILKNAIIARLFPSICQLPPGISCSKTGDLHLLQEPFQLRMTLKISTSVLASGFKTDENTTRGEFNSVAVSPKWARTSCDIAWKASQV